MIVCIEETRQSHGELEIEFSFNSLSSLNEFYSKVSNYYSIAKIKDFKRQRVIIFGERNKVLKVLDDLAANKPISPVFNKFQVPIVLL